MNVHKNARLTPLGRERVVQLAVGIAAGVCPRPSESGRGGLSTKIHARDDRKGRPIQLLITPGQAHDLTGAELLRAAIDRGAIVSLIKPTMPPPQSPPQRPQRDRQHPEHDQAQETPPLDQSSLSRAP